MLENFAYDGKNRLPLPKNYPQPSVKLLKFSWPLFSWWKFYMKKWITVVIVDILFLIYFTWFVHNFVNHKYNVLLKRNDVCLIPLNTFVCVCVCFTSTSQWRLHLSGTVGMSGNRSMMLCWRRFFPLPSPFIATLAPSLTTLSYSHTRSRQSHELTRVRLACQKLDSILRHFCNSLTFRWQERNQKYP